MYTRAGRHVAGDPLALLSEYPPELLQSAMRVLAWLEAVEWRWDINTILAQPADMLDAVMTLKSIGEEIRQNERSGNGTETAVNTVEFGAG